MGVIQDLQHGRVLLVQFEGSGGEDKYCVWIESQVEEEGPGVGINPVGVVNPKDTWL